MRSSWVALHPEGVDRNLGDRMGGLVVLHGSPSTRRAWIEIPDHADEAAPCTVALHPEGVDRNSKLLTNGVLAKPSPSTRRAWIEIFAQTTYRHAWSRSPSTRRAWIEILTSLTMTATRSSPSTRRAWIEIPKSRPRRRRSSSPSTRRAWIEMPSRTIRCSITSVALHPEGVDRNHIYTRSSVDTIGRPPPGGRG